MSNLKLYHGSDSLFTSFSLEKVGIHGSEHGYGIYLTTSVSDAMLYGKYIYEVELKEYDHSLSDEHISPHFINVLQELLIQLQEIDSTFFDNWVDTSLVDEQKALQEISISLLNYNDNEMDIVCEICNIYGSIEEVLVLVSKLGYTQHHYNANDDIGVVRTVFFNPNNIIIKSVK